MDERIRTGIHIVRTVAAVFPHNLMQWSYLEL
jgi:hypothetical protein